MMADPLLGAFVGVMAGVFGGALALLACVSLWLRRRHPALVREIWFRYGSWVGIAAVVLGALGLGRSAWIAFVALLSLAAFHEYARAVGLWVDRSFVALGYAVILVIHACAWWPYRDASPEPGWYGLFTAMPAYGTLAVVALPALLGRFEQMLQRVCLTVLGVLYFGWVLGHLAYLVNLRRGVGLVLFLAFLVSLNDVAAFTTGKLAGRHPLRPALSPAKTWEGAAGSLVVTAGAAWLLRWLLPGATPLQVVGAGVLVSVGSALGDLALSVLKRDLGIKDWSQTIPGHGGLLDRVNSLVFAAPLFFHYAKGVLA